LYGKYTCGTRVLVQPVVPDVTDDADDPEPGQVHHRNPDTPSDGIAERRDELREPLVDDRHLRGRLGIGLCEGAATEERDLQRAEVIGRNRPVVHVAEYRGFRVEALELDAAGLRAASKRQPVDQ
jgi:hypothetical protein